MSIANVRTEQTGTAGMVQQEGAISRGPRLPFGPGDIFRWAFMAASVALAAWLLRTGTDGREYPYAAGRVTLGLLTAWLAAVLVRLRIRELSFRLRGTTDANLVIVALSRLLTFALCFLPSLAVGWYAVESPGGSSRNSAGRDVCDVSTAQHCVSGPRALIPWAILLFAAGLWLFIVMVRKWRRGDMAGTPTTPPSSPAPTTVQAPEATAVVQRLGELDAMRRSGALTDAEFEQLKAALMATMAAQ